MATGAPQLQHLHQCRLPASTSCFVSSMLGSGTSRYRDPAGADRAGAPLSKPVQMIAGEVAKLALARGYINVLGKTPEATMASAMYTDVKRKGAEGTSTFIRPHEGLFGLREWVDRNIPFQVSCSSDAQAWSVNTQLVRKNSSPCSLHLMHGTSDCLHI